MALIYVLTKEFEDGSGFGVCGATTSEGIANAWRIAGNNDPVACAYPIDLDGEILGEGYKMLGHP